MVKGPTENYFPSEDFREFLYRIQRGIVPGYTYEQRHLFCSELSTMYWSTVWNANTPSRYSFLNSPQTLQISSTNNNDTAAGSGARQVWIRGLDANYDIIQETITLNGQTPVTTANTYFRILNVNCTVFGLDRRNRGDIYLGSGTVAGGVNSIPQGFITKEAIYSAMGIYTVPRGYTLLSFGAEYHVTSGKEVSIRSLVRTDASAPFQLVVSRNLYGGPKTDQFDLTTAAIHEFSDIEIQGKANGGNTTLAGDYQTALVDNSYL